MATLVYSPSKLSLPKHNRLSLKKSKLCNDSTSDFFPVIKNFEENPQNERDDINMDTTNHVDNYLVSLGLPNCGNTCYLNSIIQVLRFTPNFIQQIHSVLSTHKQFLENATDPDEDNQKFFYKLHLLYMTMQKQEDFLKRKVGMDVSAFLLQTIESFLASLRSLSLSFEEGEQHDAHELLLTILTTFTIFSDVVKDNLSNYYKDSSSLEDQPSIHNTSVASGKQGVKSRLKRKRKSSKSTQKSFTFPFCNDFATDLGFQGIMRHIIKCRECEKKSERTEPFTNLEVSIVDDYIIDGYIKLSECLEQRTVLNGENKYFCEDCYQKNEAVSSYDIVSPPSILLLHCSWLRQSSNMTDVEKDTTKILIPLLLKTSENPNIFCCESEEMYSLYAIVLHLGSSSEVGHYVAFIKNATKTPEIAEVMNAYQNYFSNNCCATEEILNYKLFTSSLNDWLLFDDDEVSTIYVDETLEIFPYFKYLEFSASPCLIFYFKI